MGPDETLKEYDVWLSEQIVNWQKAVQHFFGCNDKENYLKSRHELDMLKLCQRQLYLLKHQNKVD